MANHSETAPMPGPTDQNVAGLKPKESKMANPPVTDPQPPRKPAQTRIIPPEEKPKSFEDVAEHNTRALQEMAPEAQGPQTSHPPGGAKPKKGEDGRFIYTTPVEPPKE